MNKDYVRHSAVAGYIDSFLSEKRTLGFSYNFEEYLLNTFDNYCAENNLTNPAFTRQFMAGWLQRNGEEGSSYHSQRISFVRQLALYMNSLGIRAYIPVESVRKEITIPHFLSGEELQAFFQCLEEDQPHTTHADAWRMWNEYRAVFRLLYCCGMRNSEACRLRPDDVDLENGTVTVIHSKGDKDRLVYLPDDLCVMLKEYWSYLINTLGFSPQWFFPSRFPDRHVLNTTIDYRFNRAWSGTPFAGKCSKKPTVHCLRHSFVVDRMNAWIRDGLDFDTMLPYLSKYLGHSGVEESLYYYHLNEEANKLIRENDCTAARVIPGADKYAH